MGEAPGNSETSPGNPETSPGHGGTSPGSPGRSWSDLSSPGQYHVVGVGGSGMSAIATVLAAMGHRVTGSDQRESSTRARLEGAGLHTWVGHRTEGFSQADAVTVSSAVPADDPELVEARRAGIPVVTRAEMLAAICATRRVLAVAGTHGKTTTSSMLAVVLIAAGLRPSFVVGGDIAGIGPGARWDDGEWLVVEADESDATFLQLGAEGVIVTSVEADHLDFYGGMDELEAAFETFATAATGPRVICVDDPGSAALVERVTRAAPVTTYGSSAAAQIRVGETRSDRHGVQFSLDEDGSTLTAIQLRTPGRHNALNATAALSLARAIGVDLEVARRALADFGGVGRRFEQRGERDDVVYIDDYGHLPAEVAMTVAAAKTGGWNRVIAVFQPHRYTRTAALWREFAESFAGADVVIITDVYAAGESPLEGISGALVAGAVHAAHPGLDVRYIPERLDLVAGLRAELCPGDLCLTLGAGDLTTLPDELLALPS